jgi:hypothetical protein
MNANRVLVLGFFGLLFVFTSSFYLRWALFAYALVPILLLIAGQVIVPTRKYQVQVWMDSDSAPGIEVVPTRICGRDISIGYFKKWHEFQIDCKNFLLLTTVGLISLGSAYGIYDGWDLIPHSIILLNVSAAWLAIVYLAWRWFWERLIMRESTTAFGVFWCVDEEVPWNFYRVCYSFKDVDGEYRGGSVDTPFEPDGDDATIVFYNSAFPEKSVPASAMLFHRVQWVEHTSQLS